MTHLAIAEDKPRLAAALTADLALYDDLYLARHFPDGRALVDGLGDLPNLPDLILMDIEMPNMDGIAATAAVKSRHPQIRILMLTVFEDDEMLFAAIRAGADGYLLKGLPPKELHRAIHEALDGGAPMTPAMARKALRLIREPAFARSRVQNKVDKSRVGEAPVEPLSARELEVLEQLSAGLKYREIADNLILSEGTIRKHVERIYRKLRVTNKTAAVARGRELLG